MTHERFTSVRFHHFKAFRKYPLSLSRFNILVKPNNSGKSTTLGAFRILAEALRRQSRVGAMGGAFTAVISEGNFDCEECCGVPKPQRLDPKNGTMDHKVR